MSPNSSKNPTNPPAWLSDEAFEAFYSEILREYGPENGPPRKAGKKAPSVAARKAEPKKREKGIRSALTVLCLECAGIAAIAVWWIVRLL